MDFLFGILLEVYPSRQTTSKSSWMGLCFQFLLGLIVYSQNLQFLWYRKMKIAYWAEYENFWLIVSAPGAYQIMVSLGLVREFVYITLSIILGLIFILIILAFIKSKNKESSPIVRLAAKILFEIVSNVFFIPIYLLLLKICFNSKDSNSREDFETLLDFGSIGRILSGFGLAFVTFITILYEGCHFEIRPQKDDAFMNSKIDSKTDLYIRSVQIINCFLVTYLSKSNQEKIIPAFMFMYGIGAGMLIINMPYYSKYFLYYKSFFQLSLALTSLFFFIGYREDNAAVVLVLFIIMQPLIAFLTYSLIEYRFKIISSRKVSIKNSFSSLELSIRSELRNGSDEEFLKKLNKNYNGSKDRKNRVITAYYCNDILTNCSLGLNKISTISHKGFNIPLNYQIFKCKKFLLKLNEEYSLIFRLNSYIKTLIEIKERDKEFCLEYFKFFTILLKKNQNIENIKNAVISLMSKFNILDEIYIKGSSEFNQSKELKEMYGSFLCNIKGDTNQGQDILGYNWKITGSQMNNLNALIKDKMLFKISAEPKSFGKVKFMSREFSLYFKYNHLSCDDIFLWSLFPLNFRKYHEKILTQFADNSVSTVLYENTIVFILDSQGYAYECIIRAECIVLEDSFSFIFSVNPLNKNREFVLINSLGNIIDHSINLSSIMSFKKERLCGIFIQEILPELDLENIFDGHSEENIIYNKDNKPIKVIYKKISMFNVTFNVLYFFDDFESNSDENDFFSVDDKEYESVVDANEMTVKFRYESENVEEISRKLDIKENKSKLSSYSSTIPSLNPQEINSFKKSKLLMNVSKVILLILVINKKVLTLISSNLGILGYLSIEVEHSIASPALRNLNYISYGLVQCSLILRSKDIYNHFSFQQYFSDEYFDKIIDEVKYFQDKLDEDLNYWSYCSSSSLVKEEKLSYWDIRNVKEVRKENLFNFVGFILENVKTMQVQIARENMKTGKNYEKELMNVISNALDGPLDVILDHIDKLVECEANRIIFLENQKTYLLLAGAFVLALSVGIIFVYFICSDKHLDSLWEHLRTKCLAQGVGIRRKIKARVFEFHASSYELIKGESKALGQESKKFNFKHSFRFFLKFSPIFIISVLFLLITTLLFYGQLEDYLYYRPFIITAFPRRRVQMSVISYLIQESYATNKNYSIGQISPDFDSLAAIKVLLPEKLKIIKLTGKYINNPNTKVLMSDYFYNRIFYKIPGGSPFLSAGSFRGVSYLNNEAIFFISFNKFQTIQQVEILINQMIEFDEVIKEFFTFSHEDSKEIIETYFGKMITFVACNSILLLICYLIIYRFVLCSKINVLNYVVKLLKLIPRVN